MFIQRSVVLVMSWIVSSSSHHKSSPTKTELDMISQLLDHFRASFCTFVTNSKSWPLITKHDNCFFSVLTYGQVENFIIDSPVAEKLFGKSVIVLEAAEDSYVTLRRISEKRSLSSTIWIMLSQELLNMDKFHGIYIPFNCEFIYINPRENVYLMTEIYQVKNSTDFITLKFGFWTKDAGLSLREEHLYQRRNDLKGQTFRTLVGSTPPYVFKKLGNAEHDGYLYEVWKELEHRVNFKSDFSEATGDKNFERTADDDDIHFAVLPIVYDSFTLDQIDISYPVYESRSYLFGHRPGSELQWNSYLKPFDTQTWWVCLAWMIFSSAALSTLYQAAWHWRISERKAKYFVFTFYESFATVFRAMCMQGSDVTPQSSSCRLLFLSIYLTALVVSSAFSAALFSLLTIPTSREPFRDFEEVINNKDFEIGLLQNGELHGILTDYIMKHPLSIQSKLLQKVRGREGFPATLLEGINEVCHNKMFVLMSELPYVLSAMQNATRDCQEKVMPSGPVIFKNFIGFGFKKGSAYKELFNFHLLKMRSEGIIQRLLLRNWPPEIPSVPAAWVRVTLSDISPILYMFGIGATMSVVFVLLENTKLWMLHKNKEKINKLEEKNCVSKINSTTPTNLNVDRIWKRDGSENELLKCISFGDKDSN